MSKLLDKIQKANQESPRRMGFGPATQERTPPLPLLIGVGSPGEGFPPEEMTRHLDALLLRVNGVQGMEALGSDQGAAPWGVWVDTPSEEIAALLKERGGDFLLFSPEQAPLEVLQDQELTKLLLVPLEWDQRLASALHDLPIDGIAAALDEGAPLNVRRLIAVSGLRRLSGKPFLLFLAHGPSQKQLEVLRDSGVDCVLLDMATMGPEGMEEVRRHINGLPRRQRRPGQGRPPALLPQMQTTEGSRVEEEEEEEDF